VVEKILSHRIDGNVCYLANLVGQVGRKLTKLQNKPHFEVKWEGYEKKSERTWEPEVHLMWVPCPSTLPIVAANTNLQRKCVPYPYRVSGVDWWARPTFRRQHRIAQEQEAWPGFDGRRCPGWEEVQKERGPSFRRRATADSQGGYLETPSRKLGRSHRPTGCLRR